MAKPSKLKHPPIKEAVIAVRFRPPLTEHFADKVPKQVVQKYSGGRRTRHEYKTEIRMHESAQPGSTASARIDAELFDSKDSSRTVVVGRDVLSLSALNGKYSHWEDFENEFRDIWLQFCDQNKPSMVWRVSTRFINEIFLPENVAIDLDEYFIHGPKTPENLPNVVMTFSHRVAVPLEFGVAAITLAHDGSAEAGRMRIMLDVDVWSDVDLSCADEQLWTRFAQLRSIKNDAFFGSLTEKAVELFR